MKSYACWKHFDWTCQAKILHEMTNSTVLYSKHFRVTLNASSVYWYMLESLTNCWCVCVCLCVSVEIINLPIYRKRQLYLIHSGYRKLEKWLCPSITPSCFCSLSLFFHKNIAETFVGFITKSLLNRQK